MAQFDLAAADAILKENYLPPIREQMNLSTPFLAEVQRNTENVSGKRVYLPLHISRAENVGARAEYGDLPTARPQGYIESVFNVKYNYARIELTLPTIKATKDDKGSFLRAVESETKGAMNELKEDFNRQLVANDSTGSGALAQVADAEASAQTVLSLGEPAGTGVTKATFRRLRVGMFVDVYDDVDGTPALIADGVEITAIDKVNETVTLASGITADADDATFIYRQDAKDNELVGLVGIVSDTGELQGVDPADAGSEPWAATVNDNGGTPRALSEDLMQQVEDDVFDESGEETTHILTDSTQRRKFYALLQSQKRAVNTQELKGGFKALTFNDNTPIMVDRFVDSDRMYFLNMPHLSIFEMADWDWADLDGSVLSRVANKPGFEAWLYKYAELGTDKRNSHGVITDLTE